MKRKFKGIIVIILITAMIVSVTSACTEEEMKKSNSAAKYKSYIESIYNENSFQYETDISIRISEEGAEFLSDIFENDSIKELNLDVSIKGIYDIPQKTLANSISLSGVYNLTVFDAPNMINFFIKDNTFCMDFEAFYNALFLMYGDNETTYQYDNPYVVADFSENDKTENLWNKQDINSFDSPLCDFVSQTAVFNHTENESDFIIDNTSSTKLINCLSDIVQNNKTDALENVNSLLNSFLSFDCQEALKEFANQNSEENNNSVYCSLGDTLISLEQFLSMTEDELTEYITESAERAVSCYSTFQCNSIIEATDSGYNLSTAFTMIHNESTLATIIVSCDIDTRKDASTIYFPSIAFDMLDVTNALFCDSITEVAVEEQLEEQSEEQQIETNAESGTETEESKESEELEESEGETTALDNTENESKSLDEIAKEVGENAAKFTEDNLEETTVDNDDISDNADIENHIDPPVQTEPTMVNPTKATKDNIFNQKQKCIFCNHIRINDGFVCFYR